MAPFRSQKSLSRRGSILLIVLVIVSVIEALSVSLAGLALSYFDSPLTRLNKSEIGAVIVGHNAMTYLKNDSYYQETIHHSPAFRCKDHQDSCLDTSQHPSSIDKIYGPQGPVMASGSHYMENGDSCSGSQHCPLQLQLEWLAICKDSSCIDPIVELTVNVSDANNGGILYSEKADFE